MITNMDVIVKENYACVPEIIFKFLVGLPHAPFLIEFL